jgi:penicillin-binding protein 1A
MATDGKGKIRLKRSTGKRLLGWIIYLILLFLSIGIGTLAGLYFGFRYDLPEVRTLENYRPDVITEIYSDDNRVIGQFAIQKRVILTYSQIPKRFIQALVAAEDQHFYSHPGVDIQGIARAAYKNLRAGKVVGGGSTLTQQISKLLFLTPEQSLERKIREAILALQIERHYSKEQILTLYSNQIYMGDGTYGLAAAAQYYFGKEVADLNLPECAMLAALANFPWKFSPLYHPDNALARRSYVLRRMFEEKFITQEEYDESRLQPLQLKPPQRKSEVAGYFIEWVRRYLSQKYETDDIWRKGLRVYTTLNLDMQNAAEEAVQAGLRRIDKEHGWRGAPRNIFKEGLAKPEDFTVPEWKIALEKGQIVTALVLDSSPQQAHLKIAGFKAILDRKGTAWTNREIISDILSRGDVVPVLIDEVDYTNSTMKVSLEQTPAVQGALLLIENASGEIKAMVGGFDFDTSQFNRATQALRQTGSAFKPFVYTTALESGMEPDDTVLDAPMSFTDNLGRVWAPGNYDGKYKGLITLRKALAESRNLPAVRLGNRVGVTNIIRTARRFGVTTPLQPYLPLAIGASEVSLLEMTSAFSVFPNKGVLAKPYFIKRVEDYDHIERESQWDPQVREVIAPEIAAKMTSLLLGSVEFGTSVRAKELKRPMGGKTGTTNDFTDAWFIGFTPSLTCGVWVGFDDKQKSLGDKATGGAVALPVWIDFMGAVLKDKPAEPFEFPEGIEAPPGARPGLIFHPGQPVVPVEGISGRVGR